MIFCRRIIFEFRVRSSSSGSGSLGCWWIPLPLPFVSSEEWNFLPPSDNVQCWLRKEESPLLRQCWHCLPQSKLFLFVETLFVEGFFCRGDRCRCRGGIDRRRGQVGWEGDSDMGSLSMSSSSSLLLSLPFLWHLSPGSSNSYCGLIESLDLIHRSLSNCDLSTSGTSTRSTRR